VHLLVLESVLGVLAYQLHKWPKLKRIQMIVCFVNFAVENSMIMLQQGILHSVRQNLKRTK